MADGSTLQHDAAVVAKLASILHTFGSVESASRAPGCHRACTFPSLKILVDAAMSYVVSVCGGTDVEIMKSVKKQFQSAALAKCPDRPWTVDSLVALLACTNHILPSCASRLHQGGCACIDGQVATAVRAKELSARISRFNDKRQVADPDVAMPSQLKKGGNSLLEGLNSPGSTSWHSLPEFKSSNSSAGSQGDAFSDCASLPAVSDIGQDEAGDFETSSVSSAGALVRASSCASQVLNSHLQLCKDGQPPVKRRGSNFIPKDVSLQILASKDAQKIAELVHILHSERDAACSQAALASKNAKNASRQKNYHVKIASELREQLVQTQAEKRQLEHGIVKFSKRRKVGAKRFECTLAGGYRLALSRNLGHAGSTAALQSLECDSTRFVTVRWELLLSNSIACAHEVWHGHAAQSIEQAVQSAGEDSGVVALELHAVSGDASNASVVQSKKTHVCRVHSVYAVHTSTERDGIKTWFKWSRVQYGDVQLLPEKLGRNFGRVP